MTYGIQTAYEQLYYKRTSHTSQQTGSSTTGGSIIILGSEASYTPSSSSSKVVYEINFYGERISWIHNVSFLLEHYSSGAWSEINTKNARSSAQSGSAAQEMRNNFHLRWIIPTWTGSKDLRLKLLTRATNYHVHLHKLTTWDGSTSSTDFSDTSLIIYSV
tara:strand:+ start:1050 stop:1532 length:483 start_codon:yes stop_codon:yes gene_type:complete